MKRAFSRIYRLHGIRYFALPIIVALMLVVLVDQVVPGYLERRSEAAELAATLESNTATLTLGDRLRKNSDALTADFDASRKLVFFDEDVAHAGQEFQNQVRQILQSLYFDDIELPAFTQHKQENATVMVTEARFTGVPQQLPRLEAAIASAPSLLAVDALEIKVIGDMKRGGKQLSIIARFSALQMNPVELPKMEAAQR